MLPVARGRRRAASRVHYSHQHHDAGLSELQGLQGVRQCKPAGWLECLGHARALAGATAAEHPAETNENEHRQLSETSAIPGRRRSRVYPRSATYLPKSAKADFGAANPETILRDARYARSSG